ncbi:hypothetical protein Tco_0097052 [Tanacetum coccineum]
MLTRVLRIILVILPEHPSDTYILTMKMEILLEPASNKLLVGNELTASLNRTISNYLIHSHRDDYLNLPDHRIHKDEMVMPNASGVELLPDNAHAQLYKDIL